MKLIISPKKSISNSEEKDLKKIIKLAVKLLQKNKISFPQKIYFYNSFQDFIKKVLPEVKNYGLNENISNEIIKCALNNGTYGTINFKEDSIVEMNFNPFNKGEYSSLDFLELVIHDSLHLHLSKKFKKDINSLKFKFDNERFIGKREIIQFDEGYAEFMTRKILKRIDIKEVKKIKIPIKNKKRPKYKREINNLDIENFDKKFEELVISNRKIGLKKFEEKFRENADGKEVLNFALDKLKNLL